MNASSELGETTTAEGQIALLLTSTCYEENERKDRIVIYFWAFFLGGGKGKKTYGNDCGREGKGKTKT